MPEEAAHQLQQTVDEIVGYSRRTRILVANIRKLVIGLAIEAVLGVAVTVIVIILLISYRDQGTALRQQTVALHQQTVTLQQQATALHKSQLANCALSNETKAKELALWRDLANLSAMSNQSNGMTPTPETKKLTQQFLGDVSTTYTPLDCAKIYRAG